MLRFDVSWVAKTGRACGGARSASAILDKRLWRMGRLLTAGDDVSQHSVQHKEEKTPHLLEARLAAAKAVVASLGSGRLSGHSAVAGLRRGEEPECHDREREHEYHDRSRLGEP